MTKQDKLKMAENIRGLELVLEENADPFISRNYMIEELKRIRNGTMIFHPSIIQGVKDEREWRFL